MSVIFWLPQLCSVGEQQPYKTAATGSMPALPACCRRMRCCARLGFTFTGVPALARGRATRHSETSWVACSQVERRLAASAEPEDVVRLAATLGDLAQTLPRLRAALS